MIAFTVKVYAVLSVLIVLGSLYWADDHLTTGLSLSLIAFGVNFYWMAKAVDAQLKPFRGEETSPLFLFLSNLRILIVLLSIFAILVAFGRVPVLIGISLVVSTLLGSALVFEYLDRKDNFNE